jgi:tryptophan synthase beta chain
MNEHKIHLSEREMPQSWYNIQPDLPVPLPPPLHPGTLQPVGPDDLSPIFPMGLILQEVAQERFIEIPEEVRAAYCQYRPTPLHRAHGLEKLLDTPAHIYFKNESVGPAGSHKINTALAQAYFNKQAGVKRLVTETGAGQWGSALSYACRLFGLDCKVFMVKASYHQKPYRRLLMETYGATVFASPTDQTDAGRRILHESPDSPGSLGMAISEAVETAAKSSDTNYALGSVLNHVLLHQTIIGQETKKQMEIAGEYPDILIGCVGGGSNFGGFVFPFVSDKLGSHPNLRLIAVEPSACPSLTQGTYTYDFGDTIGMTPLMKMHTLGHQFVPAPIHAGGLRYHGDSPLVCLLYDQKVIEAVAVRQTAVFEAAMMFARTEGIVPAPESAHAIRTAIDEAVRCRESGERKVIVFALSGHGHFDMAAYDAYLRDRLEDSEFDATGLSRSLARLPKIDAA